MYVYYYYLNLFNIQFFLLKVQSWMGEVWTKYVQFKRKFVDYEIHLT